MSKPSRVVGQSVTRVDAIDKVSGRVRYAVDLGWDDCLHGAVVRSQRAHAHVRNIDVSAALVRPGVEAVVTFDDLDGLFAYFGHHRPDHPILAPGRVRYWGEPVAVVIADTPAHAHDARDDVVVAYDDIEALMDIDAAMRPGVPLIHPDHPMPGEPFGIGSEAGPRDTNIGFVSTMDWGDVDGALAAAAHVVTSTVEYPMLYAYAMEPYSAHARFVGGVLEVVSSSQHIFQVQRDLARVFDIGLNRVRVSAPTLGGGYGARSYTKIEPLAAVCSWVVRRPVKVSLDIEESMYTTRADGARVTITTGFDAEGTILARDVTILLDTGAYADNSPRVLRKSVECCFGPYRVPALRVRASAVYTNTVPASSYRGFGAYHTNAAGESNLERAASELGIDPLEIRLRNVVSRGEVLIPGTRPIDADIAEDLRLVSAALTPRSGTGRLHGIGFGCALSPEGADPTSVAMVRLLADGTALLMIGSTEMGQGSRTVLSQIVAEELGLDIGDVTVTPSDTQLAPYQWTTGASRTTAIVGLSVQRACADVRRQLIGLAADLAESDSGEWRWDDGAAVGPLGQRRVPAAIIAEWFGGSGRGELVGVGRTQRRGDVEASPALWEVGVVGVALDIDPDTGQVEIDQLVTVADVGRAINPMSVRGQDLGAATQGLGGALHEQLVYDGPQIVNSNLVEYRVPRMGDLARHIGVHIVERGDGIGPYGAKPIGEGAMTAVGGAVIAAVAQATGRWTHALPLTPERVWTMLHDDAGPD